MSGDYKWDVQCIAEELARDLFDKEFHELTDEQQMELYQSAQERYVDRMADYADSLRKAEREEK